MNSLAFQKSAYLLQHAHHPVQWEAWSDEAFERAAAQGRWVIVSIGYSTCHWCHVMAHDVFNDETVAEYMNKHFVCIKVDREERPDVDAAYMHTALALNGSGGWPLNAISLPNGSPVWVGTFLPKEQWMNVLRRLVTIQSQQSASADEYAQQIRSALTPQSLPAVNWTEEIAWIHWKSLQSKWDKTRGGHLRSVRFPLPNEWLQWWKFGKVRGDSEVMAHVTHTLNQWFISGSYDALEGGIMRYATEPTLRIPHFEKMLYDNALFLEACAWVGLSSASQATEWFLNHTMRLSSGVYATGWDADSEGEEGMYHTWTEAELSTALGELPAAQLVESLRKEGGLPWEKRWILHRADLSVADQKSLRLFRQEYKTKPSQDTKALLGWNGLVVSAFVALERHASIPSPAVALAEKCWVLFGFPQGTPSRILFEKEETASSSLPAQLDDLVCIARAFWHCAALSGNPHWVQRAQTVLEWVLDRFPSFGPLRAALPSSALHRPFVEHVETEDSVIPSANAYLTELLWEMGHALARPAWIAHAQEAVLSMSAAMEKEPENHTHWLALSLRIFNGPHTHWRIRGSSAAAWRAAADEQRLFSPYVTLVLEEESLSETSAYCCTGTVCSAPVTTLETFLRTLKHS